MGAQWTGINVVVGASGLMLASQEGILLDKPPLAGMRALIFKSKTAYVGSKPGGDGRGDSKILIACPDTGGILPAPCRRGYLEAFPAPGMEVAPEPVAVEEQ